MAIYSTAKSESRGCKSEENWWKKNGQWDGGRGQCWGSIQNFFVSLFLLSVMIFLPAVFTSLFVSFLCLFIQIYSPLLFRSGVERQPGLEAAKLLRFFFPLKLLCLSLLQYSPGIDMFDSKDQFRIQMWTERLLPEQNSKQVWSSLPNWLTSCPPNVLL